ncbi:MAG: MucB/RseB C-terminal domain-containing protein [Spongiibacteraceae bacterium]
MPALYRQSQNKVRVKTILIAVLSGVLAAQVSALEPEPASSWLNKMLSSHKNVNYRGVVSYQQGSHLNSFKVLHIVKDGQEYDKFESLDGQPRPTHHQTHDLNCVHVGQRRMLMAMQDVPSKGMQRFYDIAKQGQGRVANRETVELSIRPKDVYRLGFNLSLDQTNGLLLKTEVVNQQGQVLERFQFVNLEFIVDDALDSISPLGLLAHSHQVSAMASPLSPPWQAQWLPEGFSEANMPGESAAGVSFTDGLAVFSIFVEKLAASHTFAEYGMRRGASVSYSVPFPQHESLVTVVGEVPMLTAKQVAHSLSWKSPQ